MNDWIAECGLRNADLVTQPSKEAEDRRWPTRGAAFVIKRLKRGVRCVHGGETNHKGH